MRSGYYPQSWGWVIVREGQLGAGWQKEWSIDLYWVNNGVEYHMREQEEGMTLWASRRVWPAFLMVLREYTLTVEVHEFPGPSDFDLHSLAGIAIPFRFRQCIHAELAMWALGELYG